MSKSYKYRRVISGGVLLLLLLTISCEKKTTYTQYFPEIGQDAIIQRTKELSSNLKVLSLAIEPGQEDLAALAYFRLERGATILSAFVTNGESTPDDHWVDYPNYIAATRRLEASEAMQHLDSDVHFLNMPDVAAARDSSNIREKWPKNKMHNKLIALINEFKPDIILIAKDWTWGENYLRWKIVRDDLIATQKNSGANRLTNNGSDWQVARILAEKIVGGYPLPVNARHSFIGERYISIGVEAGNKYRSLAIQRMDWMKERNSNYSIIYPLETPDVKSIDSDLPPRTTSRLRRLAKSINRIAENAGKDEPEKSLRSISTVIDSVTTEISRRFSYSPKDQRALFHWKNILEELRCSLLGVKVNFSVSDDTLTMTQLTYVTVENVEGLEEEGETSVMFGGLSNKWVINEGFDKQFKYRPGDSYRLLSPSELTLTTPQAEFGLDLAKVKQPIILFIVHTGSTKERSFVHRSKIYFHYAQKFSAEVLTPIVMMIPNEKLVLRFTNNSRDGTKDTVKVDHPLVESTPGPFRLNQKGATYLDTLTLIWKGDAGSGNYVVPIDIKGINVGNFAVRKFDFEVDKTKKIGVIEGVANSPIFPALRRLGIKSKRLSTKNDLSELINDLEVVVIDARATTFKNLEKYKRELESFAEKGGHVLFFWQEADPWNKQKWFEDVRLAASRQFDEAYPITIDEDHPFMSNPNQLNEKDWEGWLFARSHNLVKIDVSASWSSPLKSGHESHPLIASRSSGEGKITYVDLAIYPQLLNIHEGAYRLLANLISN